MKTKPVGGLLDEIFTKEELEKVKEAALKKIEELKPQPVKMSKSLENVVSPLPLTEKEYKTHFRSLTGKEFMHYIQTGEMPEDKEEEKFQEITE